MRARPAALRLLIVDDVRTTGATAVPARRHCRRAGARKLGILTATAAVQEEGKQWELTHDFRQRTALLLGDERMARLQNARVAVFGLAAWAARAPEALCPARGWDA